MFTFRVFTSLAIACALFSGCATIVNDPTIPIAASFSDGSSGQCVFRNKRGAWSAQIPTNAVMIRRSDDALIYNCTTTDGRTVTGSIRSEMEGGKMAASVMFWDFGITDAITDKHRTYQGNIVIPVLPVARDDIAPKAKPSETIVMTTSAAPDFDESESILTPMDEPSIGSENGCVAPEAPPGMSTNPDKAELLAAQRRLQAFQSANKTYRTCLKEALSQQALARSDRDQLVVAHNASLTIEEAVANEFNDAIVAFESR